MSDSRIAVGTAGGDQTYASIFIGGALTTGTSQYAILLDPQLSASGDNYGLFANARIKASTAVNNAFGVYIPSAEKLAGASIVNNYALYIANQTSGSSTNYSIYSSGGLNYFGGSVGIGVVNPSNLLHVRTASSGVSARTDLGGTIIAEGSTRAGLYILTSGTAAGSYGSIWWGNGNINTDASITVGNDTRAMDFGTADGFRMRITSGGNVGINTQSPNSLLEVNRIITFSSIDTYGQLLVKTTSGANGKLLNIGVDETNSVSFIQSLNRGIDAMPLSLQRYGGNVGIGTIAPSTILHLNSTNTQLTLQNTDGGTNAERIGMFMTGGDTFKLISLNDNNTTRVDSILVANVINGNVGIGASPNARLQVQVDTDFAGGVNYTTPHLFVRSGASAASGNVTRFAMGVFDGAQVYLDTICTSTGGGTADLAISTRNGGAPTEKFRISATGNVGINTTNLPFTLNIESSSDAAARIKSTSSSGTARLLLNPEGPGGGVGSTADAVIFFDMNSTAWVTGVDKSDSSKYKIAVDPYGDFRAGVHLSIDNTTDRSNVVIGGTTALSTAANRGNLTINGANNSILAYGTGGTLRGYLYCNGTSFFMNSGAGDFTIENNNATAFVVNQNGFVGVRTQPLYQFSVNGSSNGIDFETNNNSTFATSIYYTIRETGVSRTITTGGYSYGPSNPLTMILTQNSNTPLGMFYAADNAEGAGLKGYKSRGTVAAPVSVNNGDTIFSVESWAFHGSGPNHAKLGAGIRFVKDDGFGTANTYAPQRIEFYNANSTTTLQTNMAIFPNGNTVIGTNTYYGSYKLSVEGNLFTTGYLRIETGASDSQIIFKNNYSSNARSLNYNVGDGTFTFNATNAVQTAIFYNNGNATFTGSCTATSFFESSDSRIKTLLDNNVDYSLIANVVARYYEKNGVEELGYFAQDFEQILPSAVYKDDKGLLNLSYTQVHTAKIAALEKEVAELKQQLKNK